MRAIIIDDELDAVVILRSFMERYCPEIEVVASAHKIEEAIQKVHEHQPDFLLLDIRLSEGTGFDLLERLTKPINVIFTTAYEQYAIRAFRYSAIDYLLKPIDPDLLIEAISKVKNVMPISSSQTTHFSDIYHADSIQTITLPSNDGYKIVEINDILWCEADANYAKITIKALPHPLIVSEPLKTYESLLPNHFFRVHQSFLINMMHVGEYVRTDGGYVIMKNGIKIPVSRRKKSLFMQKLKNA